MFNLQLEGKFGDKMEIMFGDSFLVLKGQKADKLVCLSAQIPLFRVAEGRQGGEKAQNMGKLVSTQKVKGDMILAYLFDQRQSAEAVLTVYENGLKFSTDVYGEIFLQSSQVSAAKYC